MEGSAPIEAEVVALPAREALAAEWLALEAASDGSFFLSWSWIGHWLAALPDGVEALLVRARSSGRTVGLAVLCRGVSRRMRIVRSPALFLHRTGIDEFDELTIEYNGVLAERGREREVLAAAFDAIDKVAGWDELFLDGWERVELLDAVGSPRARLFTERRRIYRYVDLRKLAEDGRPFMATISNKRRTTLRRTLREAEAIGPVKLDFAADVDEALAYLRGLKELHQAAWQAKGQPGVFTNAWFDRFHESLIAALFPAGRVQMVRFSAGGRPLGYLYNFVHRGHVYVYQTGFDFDARNRSVWSPGFACHALAIERNRDLGHVLYDLMAGDSRYKKDLSNAFGTMDWVVLQRPRLKFAVHRLARKVRRRFQPVPDEGAAEAT